MIGKVIGCIIGAILGKIPGFWVGLAIGHFCDIVLRKNKTEEATNDFHKEMARERELLFVSFLCKAAAKVAKIKGRIHENDIAILENVFLRFKLSPEERLTAIGIFRKSKDSDRPLDDVLYVFAKNFQDKPSRNTFLNLLAQIIFSDNHISSDEEIALREAADIFGLNPRIVDEIINSYKGRFSGRTSNSRYEDNYQSSQRSYFQDPETTAAYAVLGLKPSASQADVKKAYREKCKELHPDVLRSKDLGDMAMKVLAEEMVRVNEAYSKLSKR